MKLVHYALLFLCIILPIFTVTTINNSLVIAQKKYRDRIEQGLTEAVNAAVSSWVMEEGSDEKSIYKDYLIMNFYEGLFASLGILDDKSRQERMKMNIPVICIMYDQGFVFRYMTEEAEAVQSRVVYRYSELKPYYWTKGDSIYSIISNNRVCVYDKEGEAIEVIEIDDVAAEAKAAVAKRISEEMTAFCRRYGNSVEFDDSVISGFSFITGDGSHMERSLHTNGIIAFYYDKNIKGLFAAAGYDRRTDIY